MTYTYTPPIKLVRLGSTWVRTDRIDAIEPRAYWPADTTIYLSGGGTVYVSGTPDTIIKTLSKENNE